MGNDDGGSAIGINLKPELRIAVFEIVVADIDGFEAVSQVAAEESSRERKALALQQLPNPLDVAADFQLSERLPFGVNENGAVLIGRVSHHFISLKLVRERGTLSPCRASTFSVAMDKVASGRQDLPWPISTALPSPKHRPPFTAMARASRSSR
jgi:hypothetical protein